MDYPYCSPYKYCTATVITKSTHKMIRKVKIFKCDSTVLFITIPITEIATHTKDTKERKGV